MQVLVFLVITLCNFIHVNSPNVQSFKSEQMQHRRVLEAYEQKKDVVAAYFADEGLELGNSEIFIRAFKKERELEVYARKRGTEQFKLVKTYRFCTSSGRLGPKRKQGDYQIPEGYYHIDRYNPWSNFHLSLGVNYPNASDRKLSSHEKLGGDIFLHGNCVSIGCIPITDDKIKELYIMAVEARNGGQTKIPVHIFPLRFQYQRLLNLESGFDKEVLRFWKNIRSGYDHFEEKRTLPTVSIGSDGYYRFSD